MRGNGETEQDGLSVLDCTSYRDERKGKNTVFFRAQVFFPVQFV